MSEARHLIYDAGLLITQYRNRNDPRLALTPLQRRAWAAEVVEVLERMRQQLRAEIGSPGSESAAVGEWNLAMREGSRPVTFKVSIEASDSDLGNL